MKTASIIRIITGVIFCTAILSGSLVTRSQQLITFTNGSSLKVNIVDLTQDSVKYLNYEHPGAIYSESLERVAEITPLKYSEKYKPGQHVTPLPTDKSYLNYKRRISTGGIMMGTGAVLTIAGVIGWTSTVNAKNHDANVVLGGVFSVMGLAMGSGLFISGGLIAIVNSSNLSIYKKEKGFSMTLKSTPQMTGVSVAYNF